MPRLFTANALVRAVAEFVVIVVGVLVALAVNNWATSRQDRAEEVRYLQQLHDELRRDSSIFALALIPSAERSAAALRRVDSVVAGALPFPSDTMSLLMDVVSGGAEPSRLGTRTTFDELQSTGSFRLIESASLRSAILGYYGDKDLAERRAAARVSGYNEIVDSYIPSPPGGGLVGEPTATARQEMLRTQGSSRAARVVTAPDFEGAITRQRNYVGLVHAMLETLLVQNLELMTAVETEFRERR